MKIKIIREIQFFIIPFLALMVISASTPVEKDIWYLPKSTEGQYILYTTNAQNNSPCAALLLDVAEEVGLPNVQVYYDAPYDNGTGKKCTVLSNINEWNTVQLSLVIYSSPGKVCEMGKPTATFHGYDAVSYEQSSPVGDNDQTQKELFWCVPNGESTYTLQVVTFTRNTSTYGPASDPLPIAEIYWSIAKDRLSLLNESSLQIEIPTEVIVTGAPNEETDLGGQQPEVVVVPYGSDGQETPPKGTASTGSFEETWQSPQAKAVRSPIIPIAGGLLGTGLAWLLGQSAGQVNRLVVPLARPVYTPSQSIPPAITQTPPALVTEPPILVTTPPELPTQRPPLQPETTPVKPVVTQTNPYELGFNLVKDTIGATGNLMGIYEKFLTDPNSLKTVNLIRDAVNTLSQTSGPEVATEYVVTIAKANEIARAGKINNTLGVIGKGLDIVDAGVKAAKICEERGYHGWDAAMRTYAEVGKKAIVWSLTKNPVVALADAAVGGATQFVFGDAYKVDINAIVDKTNFAWDNVTRHASNKWNRSFETAANEAQIDDIRTLTQRIAQQVRDGKLTKQEGAQRLHKVLDKINQESPLL